MKLSLSEIREHIREQIILEYKEAFSQNALLEASPGTEGVEAVSPDPASPVGTGLEVVAAFDSQDLYRLGDNQETWVRATADQLPRGSRVSINMVGNQETGFVYFQSPRDDTSGQNSRPGQRWATRAFLKLKIVRSVDAAPDADQPPPPFEEYITDQESGDRFRVWVNDTHTEDAEKRVRDGGLDLDRPRVGRTTSWNNRFIRRAWERYGAEYVVFLTASDAEAAVAPLRDVDGVDVWESLTAMSDLTIDTLDLFAGGDAGSVGQASLDTMLQEAISDDITSAEDRIKALIGTSRDQVTESMKNNFEREARPVVRGLVKLRDAEDNIVTAAARAFAGTFEGERLASAIVHFGIVSAPFSRIFSGKIVELAESIKDSVEGNLYRSEDQAFESAKRSYQTILESSDSESESAESDERLASSIRSASKRWKNYKVWEALFAEAKGLSGAMWNGYTDDENIDDLIRPMGRSEFLLRFDYPTEAIINRTPEIRFTGAEPEQQQISFKFRDWYLNGDSISDWESTSKLEFQDGGTYDDITLTQRGGGLESGISFRQLSNTSRDQYIVGEVLADLNLAAGDVEWKLNGAELAYIMAYAVAKSVDPTKPWVRNGQWLGPQQAFDSDFIDIIQDHTDLWDWEPS